MLLDEMDSKPNSSKRLPTISPWSAGAVLLACVAICVHIGMWCKEKGTWEQGFFVPSAGEMLLLGHFGGMVLGLVFSMVGLTSQTQHRWFSRLTPLLTIAVFVAGLAFLKFGWVHEPYSGGAPN